MHAAKYSPDGRSIASAGVDGRIRLWNAETGQLLATITGHADMVMDLAFSPDGQTIASSSERQDGDALGRRHRSAAGARSKGTPLGSTAWRSVPTAAGSSPRGHDQTVRLWDAASGAELLTLKGHSGPVRSVAFSGDGRQIASASDDGTIIVWEAAPATPQPGVKEGL